MNIVEEKLDLQKIVFIGRRKRDGGESNLPDFSGCASEFGFAGTD
jgi:hypothetical protein